MAARESSPPPPPVIGKAGPYTVFITPPPTQRPSEASRSLRSSLSPRGEGSSQAKGVVEKSPAVAPPPLPPPVQVPPLQFGKGKSGNSSGSVFGFLWDAVAKVQDAHSSLDQYMSDWLGLDQSRYQWALNDYYENHGAGKDGGKPKELASKMQAV